MGNGEQLMAADAASQHPVSRQWRGLADERKSPIPVGSFRKYHKTIAALEKDGYEANTDYIVAELNFGFWVSLLGKPYDATLWRHTLHKGFRASGGGKKRSDVHGRFNAVRRLRNRVAHHEPIFHKPLLQLHTETIEAIGWMCKHTSAWAAHHADSTKSQQLQGQSPA